MSPLELACLVIVAAYVANAARLGQARDAAFWVPAIAAASWLAEDTCIRAYAYYGYAPSWHGFVDHVPVMIALIWPVVICSARDVAAALLPDRPSAVPWVAAAIVLADASLIEPVAVKAALWAWATPGLFGVPPIGLAGWALFALACQLAMAWLRGPARLLVLVLAPAFTHLGLVALWWGGYRLVAGAVVNEGVAAAVAILGLAALGAYGLRRRAVATMPLGLAWPRMFAAAFFFGLLFLYGRDDPALVAYVLAFAMPYLAVLGMRSSGSPSQIQAM